MKTNELRLNNLVEPMPNYKKVYGDFPAVITTIYQDKFIVCNHYPGTWFQPIPLTEEWLVKFGWQWNQRTNSYENRDTRMHLEYRQLNGSYKMFNYVLKAIICERIWYVHQLQNLYFALTGEELKIKI